MNYLHIIENLPFSTSLTSPLDGSTLYTVASRRGPEGWWSDVIYRVELEDADGDTSITEKHQVYTELATVLYIDAGTTHVRFARSLGPGDQEEGAVELELDKFLRRTKAYSNSRIFVGLDGMTYKWRIDGSRLELISTATQTVIARSHPRPHKSPFPISLLGTTKGTNHPTTTPTMSAPHSSYPTLSLHPALLSSDSSSNTPQLLDAITLTYFIMQRLLRERAKFRYP